MIYQCSNKRVNYFDKFVLLLHLCILSPLLTILRVQGKVIEINNRAKTDKYSCARERHLKKYVIIVRVPSSHCTLNCNKNNKSNVLQCEREGKTKQKTIDSSAHTDFLERIYKF